MSNNSDGYFIKQFKNLKPLSQKQQRQQNRKIKKRTSETLQKFTFKTKNFRSQPYLSAYKSVDISIFFIVNTKQKTVSFPFAQISEYLSS